MWQLINFLSSDQKKVNITLKTPSNFQGALGVIVQVWLSPAQPDIDDGKLMSAFTALKQTYDLCM